MDNRIADVELVEPGDEEEATAGAMKRNLGVVFDAPGERPELLFGAGGVEEDETSGQPPAVNNGERGLELVVVEHEFGRGCGSAP